MKSNIIKEFNLPPYIKGKSFAEASKAIDNKFKGREGAEVERTKKELLSRLSKAQEYTKMQESLQANSSEVPDHMNGQVPQEMQQFAKGGWSNEFGGGGRAPVQTVNSLTPNGVQMGAQQQPIAGGLQALKILNLLQE